MMNMPNNQESRHESIWSRAFVVLLAANFFQSMAAFMANTTIPLYVDSIGASAGIIGVIVGAFAITALLVRPFAGPAFDSFSRKKLLMAAQGIIAAAFALYGFAHTVPALFAVRMLHGVGIGCAGPLAMSLVSEYLPQSRMASGVSIYMIAQSMAQVIGPATGLWLVEAVSFQATYLIAAVFLFASMASISTLREIPRQKPPYRLELGRMFAREAASHAVVLALFATAFGATTSYLVLYAAKLGIENVGAYFVVYAVCLLVTRPLFGKIADRFGAERILVPGTICFAAAYIMLGHINDLFGLIVVAVVAAAGFGSCVPLVQSLAMSSVDVGRRGAASNTTYTGMDVGFLVGPALAGLVIEVLHPITGDLLWAYSNMWYVMLAPLVAALVIIGAWNVKRTRDNKPSA